MRLIDIVIVSNKLNEILLQIYKFSDIVYDSIRNKFNIFIAAHDNNKSIIDIYKVRDNNLILLDDNIPVENYISDVRLKAYTNISNFVHSIDGDDDIIVTLDSDDSIDETFISVLFDTVNNHKDKDVFFIQNEILKYEDKEIQLKDEYSDNLLSDFSSYNINVYLHSVCFSTKLIPELFKDFPSNILTFEDQIVKYRLIKHCMKYNNYHIVDSITYHYNRISNANNLTVSDDYVNEDRFRQIFRSNLIALSYIEEQDIRESFRSYNMYYHANKCHITKDIYKRCINENLYLVRKLGLVYTDNTIMNNMLERINEHKLYNTIS